MKIAAFQAITNHSFWTFYIGGKPVVYIIHRKIHGCFEIPDIFHVQHSKYKSGIFAHSCIIFYLFNCKTGVQKYRYIYEIKLYCPRKRNSSFSIVFFSHCHLNPHSIDVIFRNFSLKSSCALSDIFNPLHN